MVMDFYILIKVIAIYFIGFCIAVYVLRNEIGEKTTNMFLAVDKNGIECIYEGYPDRDTTLGAWFPAAAVYGQDAPAYIELPTGSIERLIGRKLTWEDDAVEFNNVC